MAVHLINLSDNSSNCGLRRDGYLCWPQRRRK